MIEAQEVLQEVEDTAAVITLKILPRPGSRPVDVDDKAAVATIAPFAGWCLAGSPRTQSAACRMSWGQLAFERSDGSWPGASGRVGLESSIEPISRWINCPAHLSIPPGRVELVGCSKVPWHPYLFIGGKGEQNLWRSTPCRTKWRQQSPFAGHVKAALARLSQACGR